MIPLDTNEQLSYDALNNRLINKMRVVLALATLLVIFIDPFKPGEPITEAFITSILYSLYAISLYLLSRRNAARVLAQYTHWIDVIWYLILIALSSGTNSIFFLLFFFAIINASFRFGHHEGMKVTLFSVVMFIFVGYVTVPYGESFELNRFLLRPVYFGVLGYMVAYWGGRELTHKKRLEILKDINNLYNPRFGIDKTLSAILQKILISFDADSCLLITADQNSSNYSIRQCYREEPEQALYAEPVTGERPLIDIPRENAVIYESISRFGGRAGSNYQVFDLENKVQTKGSQRDGEVLADFLETESFLSVPLQQRKVLTWRLYLTSRTKKFDYSDLEFLHQLLQQAYPVVENINLLDRLASEATEQQRRKISRDIHDSTIQPYIGIKFGLEALQMKFALGENINGDIQQLINLAETNIREIRSYVNRLRDGKSDVKTGNLLVTAVRQQAKKISEFYGIEIKVYAEYDFIKISDRLSAEVFQLISEALSNIKRHTNANCASIHINIDNNTDKLQLEIQNNNPNGNSVYGFIPRSIEERTNALGGQISVSNTNNQTIISIEIPL
ncbi:MAG: hypothetical protein JWN60_2122 [Acidobacteria bacterium]|nr:hypothetical protein [Acidobacteriota bacterium]